MVRSEDPSSMTRMTISSTPSIWAGIDFNTAGRVSSSLRQGTWMKTFMYVLSVARG